MDNLVGPVKRKQRPYVKLLPVVPVFAVLISMLALHVLGAVYYPGDVNVDKGIDVSDAVLLARFCAEDPDAAITRQGTINADVNADKNINGDDCITILKMIAQLVPMPPNPYLTTEPSESTATTTDTDETSKSSQNTSATTVTTTVSDETTKTSGSVVDGTEKTASTVSGTETQSTEKTETTTETTETTSVNADLTADLKPYPLGVSISVLSGQKQPNEMLTVNYEIGNIIFAIFAEDPADTTIAIAYQDDIVGYYKVCSEYTAPVGYGVREYRDEFSDETGKLYAITILRPDVSIRFDKLTDRDDLDVLSKLNYYALNGIRAKLGLPCMEWHPELAKIARAHSVDMATHNMFEHYSSDGTSRKDRMLNAGIDYMAGGENIDRGQFDTFDALDGWLGSDVHRENLLSTDYTHIGVGFAYNKDADGYFYGTQDFCSFFPD